MAEVRFSTRPGERHQRGKESIIIRDTAVQEETTLGEDNETQKEDEEE